jgi:ribonuclease HII
MEHNFKKRTLQIFRYDGRMRKRYRGHICGIDEAGRGPLAGPVVAAAVIFPDDVYIEGVFDSKKLTARKREELFEHIIATAAGWGIGIVDSKQIDSMNILQATKTAMCSAVSKLRIKPSVILVDGNFFSHDKYKVINIIRGDEKSFSIAAASIIAKVTRDRMMKDYERKFPNYSFSVHKGYGTRTHIAEITECGYSDIHRRSFKIKALE